PTYRFERQGDAVPRLVQRRYTAEYTYHRSETKPLVQPTRVPQEGGDARVTEPLNWPSFRGPDATGVADGQHPPVTWDVKAGDHGACEGVPKTKRHLKGSQANCTPATDGRRVVACFGPEGMYCYDFQGKLLWKRDLGTIDSSFSLDREYEWGFGSSPVIHDGLVILQADLSKDSFVAAYSLEDGARVWSTPRDEIPSWSSPALWRGGGRVALGANAAPYA